MGRSRPRPPPRPIEPPRIPGVARLPSIQARRFEAPDVSIALGQHVAAIADLQRPQAIELLGGAYLRGGEGWARLLPSRDLEIDLTFPMDYVARVTIEPDPGAPGRLYLGEVLWKLAEVYESIYATRTRWGVWGHRLTDLVMRRLDLSGGAGALQVTPL